MTDGCDRFVFARKVLHNFEHARIEPQIFRSSSPRNNEPLITRFIDLREGGVESESVSRLLGVSLIPFEIVDGSPYLIAGFLVGADHVHLVADGL